MLDCLGLFCWKCGLNGGALYETYSVISISIKKEVRQFLSSDFEQSMFHFDWAVTVPRRRKKYIYVTNCFEGSVGIEKNRHESRETHGRNGVHKVFSVWLDIFAGDGNQGETV